MIYPKKMVIFHSYVYVYQRVMMLISCENMWKSYPTNLTHWQFIDMHWPINKFSRWWLNVGQMDTTQHTARYVHVCTNVASHGCHMMSCLANPCQLMPGCAWQPLRSLSHDRHPHSLSLPHSKWPRFPSRRAERQRFLFSVFGKRMFGHFWNG